MVERNLDIGTVILAVTLTVVIMGGIFLMGWRLSEEKVSDLERDVVSFEVERRSQEISRQIAENLPEKNCEALEFAVEQTIIDTQNLADRVTEYEDSYKLQNDNFRELKKEYTNVLLEYWLLTEKVDDMCNSSTVRMLYFYSGQNVCPTCEDQGTIITHYRKKYNENLLVFPLDMRLDMRHLNILRETYKIEDYPVVVINGDTYRGFMDIEEMGEVLGKYMNEEPLNGTSEMVEK